MVPERWLKMIQITKLGVGSRQLTAGKHQVISKLLSSSKFSFAVPEHVAHLVKRVFLCAYLHRVQARSHDDNDLTADLQVCI